MAEIELPSTPKDINYAMATEVMGWEAFQLTWIRRPKSRMGIIYGPNIADHTPSTDLNQAFEAKFHVLKSLTHLGIDVRTTDSEAVVETWDYYEHHQVALSDPCTTPEALATALCLALIAAVRGES